MSALGTYLKKAAQTPWKDGEADCCTFLADWCIDCGYPDPMAFIRGYSSEAEALSHIQRTGLPRLADRGFRSIGLAPTDEPRDGDVAVIERPTEDGTNVVCAIRVGGKWATRIKGGIEAHTGEPITLNGVEVYAGDRLIKAWSVEWARP